MTPDEYCREATRRSGSSFYYSFKVLPEEKRRAIYCIYAFCRHADDIVDDAGPALPGVASEQAAARSLAALDQWQAEFDMCCAGTPTHPITIALREKIETYGIPREYFSQILDGVRLDLVKNRYATFEELRRYCYGVASAVGLACIQVFGYRSPLTPVYAESLGVALQLTNIIRDVGEDAARGRVYIPQEDLDRFGVRPEDLAGKHYTPAFFDLMRFQGERARRFFRQSEESLAPEDRRALLCPEIMSSVYFALLQKIDRKRYRVLDGRIRITAPAKMLLALRTCLRSLRGAP
ncbi:MAG: presqualene diphosphate synthase HpnD [Acidobacteriota bacterium]